MGTGGLMGSEQNVRLDGVECTDYKSTCGAKIIANIYVKIFKAQTSSIMKVRLYDKVACILHECGLSAPDKVGKLLGKHFFFPVGSSH